MGKEQLIALIAYPPVFAISVSGTAVGFGILTRYGPPADLAMIVGMNRPFVLRGRGPLGMFPLHPGARVNRALDVLNVPLVAMDDYLVIHWHNAQGKLRAEAARPWRRGDP